jgi:predicted permease
VALLSGLLFGLIPALKYSALKFSAPGISAALRSEGRTPTGSREHNRTRGILVAAQVALALVLLIGSGLMIRTFQALRHVDPGFSQPAQMQTFQLTIPNAMAPEMVARSENAIVEKLRAIPGVSSAGFASALPMGTAPPNWDGAFKEGQNYVPGDPMVMRLWVNASPGFFHAAGTRLLAGREFTWNDLYAMRDYVLISENLAREWWGSAGDAVGKRIRTGPLGAWREVIGVVQDVRSRGVNEPAPATIYEPVMERVLWQGNAVVALTSATFVVRSDRAGTAGLLEELQRAVWSVNAGLPLAETSTMQTIYDHSMARTSFTLVMLGIAGIMALALGIVGIYGVIAYAVSTRSREIGIRSALGEQPRRLKQMFVQHALTLAGIGVAIGLVAAIGLARLMKSLLFGISPLDPVTYAAVPVVLIAAAALASYLPARRAAAVDPAGTLRAE